MSPKEMSHRLDEIDQKLTPTNEEYIRASADGDVEALRQFFSLERVKQQLQKQMLTYRVVRDLVLNVYVERVLCQAAAELDSSPPFGWTEFGFGQPRKTFSVSLMKSASGNVEATINPSNEGLRTWHPESTLPSLLRLLDADRRSFDTEDIDDLPRNQPGVYVFWDAQDVFGISASYVGQSGDLYTRLMQHYRNPEKTNGAKEFSVCFTQTKQEAENLERPTIYYLQPTENIQR